MNIEDLKLEINSMSRMGKKGCLSKLGLYILFEKEEEYKNLTTGKFPIVGAGDNKNIKEEVWEQHRENKDNSHELKSHFCRSCVDLTLKLHKKKVKEDIDMFFDIDLNPKYASFIRIELRNKLLKKLRLQ